MIRFLPVSFLVVLTATAAQAQQGVAIAETSALPDTLHHPFRGSLPDSLALAPAPGGTFRLQGQEQPSRPFLTLQDQLRTVAGVQVTPYDGSPGSGNVVRIRGASLAQGLTQPLYVVDGLPSLNDELTPGGAPGVLATTSAQMIFTNAPQTTVAEQHAEIGASPLQLLPPEAIESIEVLSGPAAVARYGPLGANGVISIRTRRGRVDRPLHVRYAAYVGVQQVRRTYELLPANEYAEVANEAVRRQYGPAVAAPFANTNVGTGTDWQAETYRNAVLQQHQLTLDGTHAKTSYLFGFDYRQQNGVLHYSDLTRLGLRLAVDQRVGTRLHLHGTATLGQTDQRLPNALNNSGATRAALMAPPTQGVRNAQGDYSGSDYTPQAGPTKLFANPLAVAEYTYRAPRTQRLLAQLGVDYAVLPHLTVEASANFQRTLLSSDSYMPPLVFSTTASTAPTSSYAYATQTYRASQWAMQAAVRYQRVLGTRHSVSAEVDYQYQGSNVTARNDYYFGDRIAQLGLFNQGYYAQSGELRFHRPWARVQYSLDSALTLEAGLSYGHYKDATKTEYYPSAQLSWQTRPGRADVRLWAGAARTSNLGTGFNIFGPERLVPKTTVGIGYFNELRLQSGFYNDQLEAGLRLGTRNRRLTAQLVAYQRTSYHALLMQNFGLPQVSGFTNFTVFDEATIRNQGLELTLAATWQRGRLQGSSRLVASFNRNRLRQDEGLNTFGPQYANEATGTLYGYQQNGLNADGSLRFQGVANNNTTGFDQKVLGTGIPPQLASFSQQLRLSRWALDAQVDGIFGFQVINYQRQFLDTPTGYTNNATTVRDRWTPTNQSTSIPAASVAVLQPYSGDGTPISSRLVENGANVRLSSLTLAYRLRQTTTQDISLWLGAQNLLVLTSYQGYDPNVSSGGPTPVLAGLDYGAVPVPRTWLLGVKAEF